MKGGRAPLVAPGLRVSAERPLSIAVIGAGIAGLGAAWLLGRRHHVTLFEREARLGGHANTVTAAGVAVDTGFIVYNPATYPNLVGLFERLGVATQPTDMSFSASLRAGGVEYAGKGVRGLLARPRNLIDPRFWAMFRDLLRFYRSAVGVLDRGEAEGLSLGELLDQGGYAPAFIDDHLLPMAAAIWSTTPDAMRAYPAVDFVRFFDHHGLLKLRDRPVWRTVVGGSRRYVDALRADLRAEIRVGAPAARVLRGAAGPTVIDAAGRADAFDHVVLATHADDALALIDQPSAAEQQLLSVFRYSDNRAALHGDIRVMPKRRRAWSSWNYVAPDDGAPPHVAYWMNRLHGFANAPPLFVTLNAVVPAALTHYAVAYRHPLFNRATRAAQDQLSTLQGVGGLWFCGAYCGAGFHEDGLRAGLAVAEALGGAARPWSAPDGACKKDSTP